MRAGIHVSTDANICNDKFRLGEWFGGGGQNVNSATKLPESPLRFLGPMRGIASEFEEHDTQECISQSEKSRTI